tara:strand:+ start:2075 stop:2338 length:264 start_codon:yes stop_codon:yes gene_type:complete
VKIKFDYYKYVNKPVIPNIIAAEYSKSISTTRNHYKNSGIAGSNYRLTPVKSVMMIIPNTSASPDKDAWAYGSTYDYSRMGDDTVEK